MFRMECAAATVALLFVLAAAAPPPDASGCYEAASEMIDCLSYVQTGSNDSAPSAMCCREVKAVARKQPRCLCDAMQLAAQAGISVNMTRASGLPANCSIDIIPPMNCGNSSRPARAPTPAPGPRPVPVPAPPRPFSSPSPAPVPVPAPAPVPVAPPPSPANRPVPRPPSPPASPPSPHQLPPATPAAVPSPATEAPAPQHSIPPTSGKSDGVVLKASILMHAIGVLLVVV